ncbi:MAG: UDP-N-acetylglucosamine 1-carboxyvinyltransferase 1 [candidate division TM6 bacterium GW2011_GWE2_41_16]|nr:MAG: UDP-N-acetylglucosamine 1-carboxyvinyltransferase 1 [candidate division TM6 bacterium GW2011_GWE2_41_16]
MHKDHFIIHGPTPLHGTVPISGAKNAVLVELAALLLPNGVSTLTNVPLISDVYGMINLLKSFGALVHIDEIKHTVTVDARGVNAAVPPFEILRSFRASILTTGAMLSRCGCAYIEAPGGCPIGARPINLHREAFNKLGARFIEQEAFTQVIADKKLIGDMIVFDYPSVGSTENALLAAVCAQGTTTIINAAIEPEIIDLINFLISMGCKITTQTPASIIIEGVDQKTLRGISHQVIGDRLECGTWLFAAAMTQGSIITTNAPTQHMHVVLYELEKMGHDIKVDHATQTIRITSQKNYTSTSVKTMPHPGFPTDLQSPLLAVLTQAQGNGSICETVFENRFLAAPELVKMGAQITVQGSSVLVTGIEKLHGSEVEAKDIRAGAALAIAAMSAEGTTVLTGIQHIDRGYENFVQKATALGARIKRVVQNS